MSEVQSVFSVHPAQRLIRFGAVPLKLDAAEFGVLAVLIERAGRPLSGQELLAALGPVGVPGIDAPATLWEVTIRINRILSECAVEAGYVEHTPEAGFALIQPLAKAHAQPLDEADRLATGLVGRSESIELLARQLPARRFISIVGPGGIGKTTLALATARTLRTAYPDGICFVDLAPLSEGRLVPGALAGALGLPKGEGAIDLAAYLQGRRLLIILDSCEHLLADTAALVESFLSDAVQVHVLVTSREPLRALGEWLHRLDPMGLPARADALTAAEAGAYSGIELFVKRVRAGQRGFRLTDELAPSVAELCIKLDGIPLAIELAAARVALLGLHEVASQIEDRLLLLEGGSRRKPHRHRTLEAMLDWSHDLLSDPEQQALRRLSLFRGNFSLAVAAAAIGEGDGTLDEASELTEVILDLVAKSLVSRVATDGVPVFRLLDTTRVYAAAKLALDPDRQIVARRYALALRALLVEAEAAWERMTRGEWRASFAPWVNDVRAALDWAFSMPGEDELALHLTNLAFPLADQTSLMTDYGESVDRAVEALPRLQGRQPLLEIRLRTLQIFFRLRGAIDEQTAIARMQDVLALAVASDEPKSQAGPLIALWAMSYQNGDYHGALHWSRRIGEVGRPTGDPFLAQLSARTGAQACHYLGDQAQASRMAHEVLELAGRRIPWAYFPSPVDPRVSMHVVLVRVLWLQGQPRTALQLMQESLQFARTDTSQGLCHALALAALPLALWCGDARLAAQWNQELRELDVGYDFSFWHPWWQAYEEVLALWKGDAAAQPDKTSAAHRFTIKLQDQLATVDPRWLGAETRARAEAGTLGWCAPEVWRVQGEAAREQAIDASGLAKAEALFVRSLEAARQQGAVAWELRAALSLSDLWQSQGRASEARALLSGVREHFTDGFQTADLASADAKLLAWAGQP
ncbi:MAG TPA: hypothetical protein VGM81_12460 [Burkholderiaceae bacterium]|jgi:predicted ATPase